MSGRSDDELKAIVVRAAHRLHLPRGGGQPCVWAASHCGTRAAHCASRTSAPHWTTSDERARRAVGVSGFYETPPEARPAFDSRPTWPMLLQRPHSRNPHHPGVAPVARMPKAMSPRELKFNGELSTDMMPVARESHGLDRCSSSLVLRDFPPLEGLLNIEAAAAARSWLHRI